ncbi:DUF6152 family protein [Shumkonia mesophila]|uniref:DUF6152 family protein n=1 Tax=Shumkonia mesophila TaxID=2838854 RepID=UPI002934994F|nr:DUF6152 family protein [Shumkonia mesophila]
MFLSSRVLPCLRFTGVNGIPGRRFRAAGLGLAGRAAAHHGWGWATGEEFELSGEIAAVRLGNPHGELTLDVKGEQWVVEIGQPWRNERAGLTPEMLAEGTPVTAHGHRSANASERLMKAERLVIAGREHNLYPDRAS